MRQIKIIIEKYLDGYIAYPIGIKGVVVGEGNTYQEVLMDVKSAISCHIEVFGQEVFEDDSTDLIDELTQNHLGGAKIINMPIIDESKLAELYAEFAEEDRQLAEAGINEYAILLKEEDIDRSVINVNSEEERKNRLNKLFGAWKNDQNLAETFAEIDQERHQYLGRNIDNFDLKKLN